MCTNETYSSQRTFKSYLFFWIGQLVSLLGSSIVGFTVIWWVIEQSKSATLLSITMFLWFIPQVIVAPIAGVYTDRWNRKYTIAMADSAQAIITFCLIVSLLIDSTNIWFVILINAFRGVFQAFHNPAVYAIIPVMVPKENLSRINGINRLATGLINIVGPLIGAILLAFWPFHQILWVDIITFIIALIPLILISIPSVKKESDDQAPSSFIQDFKMGLKTITMTPGLFFLALWSALVNFLMTPFRTLLPYFIHVTHLGTETELAYVMTFFQVGFITGALVVTLKKTWKNKNMLIFFAGSNIFVAIAISAIAPVGNFILIMLGQLILGLTLSIGVVMYYTILQLAVPPDKQGKVYSIDMAISNIISPIAILISGPLAEIVGVRNFFLIIATLGILVNVLIMIFSDIRHIDYEKPFFDIKKDLNQGIPTIPDNSYRQ